MLWFIPYQKLGGYSEGNRSVKATPLRYWFPLKFLIHTFYEAGSRQGWVRLIGSPFYPSFHKFVAKRLLWSQSTVRRSSF